MYVIKIISSTKDCWVSSCSDGDPPRTLILEYAQKFNTKEEAFKRIKEVKETHSFKKIEYKVVKYEKF